MPMPIQALVGPAGPLTAGATPQLRLGPTGEIVQNQMYGKYYEATRLGLVFTGTQAATGLAMLTATSTTLNFVFFNPPASGKRAIFIKTTLGYVSATMTAGSLVYAVNATSVTTVTGTAGVINNNLQFGPASAMQVLTTATIGATMTLLRPSRLSQVVQAATATNAPWIWDEDLDGSIVVPPGGALSIGGNISIGNVVVTAFTWIEIPNIVGA